ncbi:hypothetical protein [Flavipsychrobacter stenotrophus]|nr:hypothetical protein [Flavipsychrobacter stenotrophus]
MGEDRCQEKVKSPIVAKVIGTLLLLQGIACFEFLLTLAACTQVSIIILYIMAIVSTVIAVFVMPRTGVFKILSGNEKTSHLTIVVLAILCFAATLPCLALAINKWFAKAAQKQHVQVMQKRYRRGTYRHGGDYKVYYAGYLFRNEPREASFNEKQKDRYDSSASLSIYYRKGLLSLYIIDSVELAGR